MTWVTLPSYHVLGSRTPREMVGRALRELEAAGAITLRQGRAVVLDRERLRLLA